MAEDAAAKKRTFRKFSYRGVDLDQLLDMNTDELVDLLHARARRRFQRGLKRKPLALIKKLRKAKKEAPSGEKPEAVRTHLRNMIIVPEMIGSVVGVYNGKTFNQVRASFIIDCLVVSCSHRCRRRRRRSDAGASSHPRRRAIAVGRSGSLSWRCERSVGGMRQRAGGVASHRTDAQSCISPPWLTQLTQHTNTNQSKKPNKQVEIKPEMVGHYLAEFSISYKPVKHGRPGIGATHSSRFIPLK